QLPRLMPFRSSGLPLGEINSLPRLVTNFDCPRLVKGRLRANRTTARKMIRLLLVIFVIGIFLRKHENSMEIGVMMWAVGASCAKAVLLRGLAHEIVPLNNRRAEVLLIALIHCCVSPSG